MLHLTLIGLSLVTSTVFQQAPAVRIYNKIEDNKTYNSLTFHAVNH